MTQKLVLASASPRRADLLTWSGVEIEIKPANIDESRRPGEAPVEYAQRLACEKSLALELNPGDKHQMVLGADTTVFIGDKIFEKPKDIEEAATHLQALSGRTHQVVTAFALASFGQLVHQEAVVSQVTFRPLSMGMIKKYLDIGESLDKAGAYGLQGLGGFMVESIEGSFATVVGLPLTEVLAALAKCGHSQ